MGWSLNQAVCCAAVQVGALKPECSIICYNHDLEVWPVTISLWNLRKVAASVLNRSISASSLDMLVFS